MKRVCFPVAAVLLGCLLLGFAACSDESAGPPEHPDGDVDSLEEIEITWDFEVDNDEFEGVTDGDVDVDLPEIDISDAYEAVYLEVEWPDSAEFPDWDERLDDAVPDVFEPVCSDDLALLNPGSWQAASPSGLPDIPLAITIVNGTETWAYRPEWIYQYSEADDHWTPVTYPPEGMIIWAVATDGAVFAGKNPNIMHFPRDLEVPCEFAVLHDGCWSCVQDVFPDVPAYSSLGAYPVVSQAKGALWNYFSANAMVSYTPGDGSLLISDIEIAGEANGVLPAAFYDTMIAAAHIRRPADDIRQTAVMRMNTENRWHATHILDDLQAEMQVGYYMTRPVIGGRDGTILRLEEDRADIWYQYPSQGRYSIIKNASDTTLYAGGEQVPLVYFDGVTWREVEVPPQVTETGYSKVVPLGGKDGEQWVIWDHMHLARYQGKNLESYVPMRDLRDLSGQAHSDFTEAYAEIHANGSGNFAMLLAQDIGTVSTWSRLYRYQERCMEMLPALEYTVFDEVRKYDLHNWTWDASDGTVYAKVRYGSTPHRILKFQEDEWVRMSLGASAPTVEAMWAGDGELWGADTNGTGIDLIRIEEDNVSGPVASIELINVYPRQLLRRDDGRFLLVVEQDDIITIYLQNDTGGFDVQASSGDVEGCYAEGMYGEDVHPVDPEHIYLTNLESYCRFDGSGFTVHPLHRPEDLDPRRYPRDIVPVDGGTLVMYNSYVCLENGDDSRCIMPPVAAQDGGYGDLAPAYLNGLVPLGDDRIMVVAWPSLMELVWPDGTEDLESPSLPMCPDNTPVPAIDAYRRCTPETPEPEPMCNEGECFIPGGSNDACGLSEGGSYSLTLSDFYMDQTEVSNGKYRQCVAQGACTPPGVDGPVTLPEYFSDEAFDNYPVVGVTWQQAHDYCAWAGKELPTSTQWMYASDNAQNTVNSGIPVCPVGEPGYWDCVAQQDSICYNYGVPVPVDALPEGASSFGMQHAWGNVREWVQNWVGDPNCVGGEECTDPSGPEQGMFKIVLGNGWADCKRWATMVYPPENASMYIGFRCARPSQ